MESIGGRETRRRDSSSSTDSWSVVDRSTSAASTNLSSSISYCSSFRDGEQNEEHEDQLSECESDVSTEDSDLELEENLSDDEVDEAEEAMENGESEEEDEDMGEKESDNEEGEDDQEDDDEISLVDENEALENEAALRYVAAEKTSRRLDVLAKQFESPFDQWIGGERNRPFVFGSLFVCSAIGLAIVQIIGSTWLANLPRSAAYQGSMMRGEVLLDLSPLDVGLQSRRLGRLQHFAPIHPLGTVKIESALPNEKRSSPRLFTYGNCTREQLRKEWAIKAVKALVQWANNFTDNQCALRELFDTETLTSSPKTRPIHVVPSISAPLPDFTISPKPSFVHRKIFRPTLSRSKRPTTERSPRPTQSPPPLAASWRKRQQKPISTHSSLQQCPRLVSLGKRGEITRKIAPPPAVSKKYRHYTKTSDGFARRSALPQTTPKIAQKSTLRMPKSNPKFSKALFNRVVSPSKFTRQGPIPPPKESKKQNRVNALQQYRPMKQHKPCKSRPEPCWNDFRMDLLKSEKKEKTSLVLRKEYSLARSIQEKKQNALRKAQRTEVCYGYSNTSTNIEKRGKVEKKRPTVQGYCSTISRSRSLTRVTEPQCDHRVWKNATKTQQKPKRPCLEHKKAVPCRENNKLDKQIRQQQKKRLRRN